MDLGLGINILAGVIQNGEKVGARGENDESGS
jgi:hypothetical protein